MGEARNILLVWNLKVPIHTEMLRFETAGESHGECLIATLTGLPASVPISLEGVNRELWRRQQGYGRGGRMKIETDRVEIVAGVRHSKTIGSPVGMIIRNADWKNWTEAMPVQDFPESGEKFKRVTRPRPGHADLAGAIKYDFHDARYILERASARETTARVAVGALAKAFLGQFGIQVLSHVIAVGTEKLGRAATWDELVALSERDEVLLGCVDSEAEQRMKALVDEAYRTGDTIGGVFEVVAHGLPVGLGSHIAWDTRLDGKLAQAIVSMQAVKGVEIGLAEEGAASFGSKVQDTIHYEKEKKHFFRGDNRAGGIEGGMTNGQDILVRGFLKPISTLRRPLESVDLETRDAAKAAYERSDVCVVPAAGVIGEAMVAIVLASAFLEKFGGDSLGETRRNFEGYQQQVAAY
jgi:chorismate synthase